MRGGDERSGSLFTLRGAGARWHLQTRRSVLGAAGAVTSAAVTTAAASRAPSEALRAALPLTGRPKPKSEKCELLYWHQRFT
jgi:hypothetical protein